MQSAISRNYSMIPNIGSPVPSTSDFNSIAGGGDSWPIYIINEIMKIPPGPALSMNAPPKITPLTREQMQQAFIYALQVLSFLTLHFFLFYF